MSSTRSSTASPRGCGCASVLAHPFMPESTEKVLAALGQEDLSLDRARIGAVPGGATVEKLEPLFPRVARAEE